VGDEQQERAELLELYRLAVEEYRFQVNLNWQRTQYLLAFNVGVLGVSIALLSVRVHGATFLTGFVFLLGAVSSVLSMLALQTQHGYYRSAREKFKTLEQLLALQPELQIETTPGMEAVPGGKAPARRVRVQTVVLTLLAAVALVDLLGTGWTFVQFFGR
jgi:hypothetical protein